MLSFNLQDLPTSSGMGLPAATLLIQDADYNQCGNTRPLADCVSSSESTLPTFYDKVQSGARRLPSDFVPGYYDVICARGKQAWHHSGNVYFRDLVKKSTSAYAKATSKTERSAVVSAIVDHMYAKGTGFVKEERGRKGLWSELGESLAREKAGQLLRNGLSTQYRSSHVAKKQKRKNCQAKRFEGLRCILLANRGIQKSVTTLEDISSNILLSDTELLARFTRAQGKIIQSINKEEGLVQRFNGAENMELLGDNESDSDTDSDC